MEYLEQPYKKNEINFLDLKTLFKFCPDGIVYKDNNLCYIDANESYKKTFSSNDFSSFIGKRNNPYISKDIMKLICDADNEVIKSCNPINYVITLENNTLLNVTSFPIKHNENLFGLISIIKDITQEEAIKEDFVNKHFEYINTEKNLQKQRETFVASLGHDLKNPTIAQIRSLELLLKGSFGEISIEQRELLEMVLDSCRYMNGMLASLLATYRDYGGQVELNFEEISLFDLVKECVSEMVYVAKDKGININIVNEAQSGIVQADRVQIKRVIMNLLSNGIKYAYTNTDLSLKMYNNSASIGFEFKNNSNYIPEEKQKAIFAQYVSYAQAHNELGIGLGLYASKKIIDGHNGRLYVKSFQENKNIFGFTIPQVRKNSSPKTVCF
ncbi:MAG: PAS domain-containing sensor histidine kinase [Cyanobacteria bacterium SIG31]|nr:PAS domain-containing sensor histidine kinase [Cyanobacteria bacterium SIG31]